MYLRLPVNKGNRLISNAKDMPPRAAETQVEQSQSLPPTPSIRFHQPNSF
jgi:hypothetical protein